MASMSPLARPMVHTAAVWYFWILQRIYELALTYPLCALLVGTELGSEDYLAPYKRLVVLPISASILRWTNASGMIIVLLRSEIPSGICAKLRTVAASNNRVHMPWSLCYCLFAPHICMVYFISYCWKQVLLRWDVCCLYKCQHSSCAFFLFPIYFVERFSR